MREVVLKRCHYSLKFTKGMIEFIAVCIGRSWLIEDFRVFYVKYLMVDERN